MLYTIIIAPIEMIVEWTFLFIYNRFSSLNVIYSVFGVSIVINFLALPLYNIADKLQEKERNISKSLESRLKRIKKAFKGDEQFMMINEYYRQNNYHPLYVLRSSLSILIEIPFFIAAYHFLSHCEYLSGQSWIFFKDLGNPDELIHFSIANKSVIISILPIIMTLINFVSGAIYCKEAPLREKLQLYGVAVLFLILLYKSPSGLVIYWILNNIFSLFKNIVMKTKNPKRILHIILTLCFLVLSIAFCIFKADSSLYKKIFLFAFTIFFALIPYLFVLLKRSALWSKINLQPNESNSKQTFILFIFSAISLWILCGILLPASVISSSPIEFSFIGNTDSPINYIKSATLLFFGFFVLWPFIIYKMFGNDVKNYLSIIIFSISICALCNVYIFKANYVSLDTFFQIESPTKNLTIPFYKSILSIFIFVVAFLLILFVKKLNKVSIISTLMLAVGIAEFGFGIYKTSFINKEFKYYSTKHVAISDNTEIKPVYHLSKTDKNVIILFLDRAIGSFPKYIFEQFPDIAQEFSGFVYYPNTLSSGGNTINGIPPTMGGYEYSSYENYIRDDMLLVDKHNEALLVMPKLFLDAGYEVTFTDPSMSNYVWEGDYTPFEKYPEINVSKQIGKYTKNYFNEKKNLIINEPDKYITKHIKDFSILQILIPCTRTIFYNTALNKTENNSDFYNNFSSLYYLPNLVDFDSSSNTLSIIENELPHRPYLLKAPDYEITMNKNEKYEVEDLYKSTNILDLKDYNVNIASYMQVSKFLKYLKDNDVYDNTRIILVSDHGYFHSYSDFANFEDPIVPSQFNCLLMYKDFNSNESFRVDNSFMTNADTLFLAKQDLGLSTKNPFTNKEFEQNKDYVICCPVQNYENNTLTGNQYNPNYMRNKTKFDYSNLKCWKVHDNIFDPNNWETFNFQ